MLVDLPDPLDAPSPTEMPEAGPAFRILGNLQVIRAGRVVDLGPTKQRALLSLLLCNTNSVVAAESLIVALWPDDAPRSAPKNLQSYVSGLRRVAMLDGAHASLDYRAPGYTLSVAADMVDAGSFDALARSGRARLRSGDHQGAAADLRAALDLWRGPALLEFRQFPALRAEAERLESRRVAAYEDLTEAELALGCAADLLDTLDDLAYQHPMRERLRSLQMMVLHRCGRQREALAVFDDLRQHLARELGLSPSPVLAELYRSVLSGEDTCHAVGLQHWRPSTSALSPARAPSQHSAKGRLVGAGVDGSI